MSTVSPTAPAEQQRRRLARLVARVYRAADAPLRLRMLDCLLRPLSTLSIAAVAAGAFGVFLHGRIAADRVTRFSREQVGELARYAHEVDPDVLRSLAELLTQPSAGVAAFSAAALVAASRRLRGAGSATR